jgi:hypothetical protein
MAKLAFDFDGTIHKGSSHYGMGEPVHGAQEALTRFHKEGHEIIVVSRTSPDLIEDWMVAHNIPFTGITTQFPDADLYVGDRNMKFHSWTMTLAALIYNLPLEKGGKKS